MGFDIIEINLVVHIYGSWVDDGCLRGVYGIVGGSWRLEVGGSWGILGKLGVAGSSREQELALIVVM